VVGSAATVTIDSSQHLASLNLDGTVTLTEGGDKVVVVGALTIGSGQLDLTDNDMIIRGGDIGTWNGSAYTGITGLLASGYDQGFWDGGGIITSETAAQSPNTLTTLGSATAGQAFGMSESETQVFDGETVAGSDVLIKYSYGGDMDLSGVINGDDYYLIDSSYPHGLHMYFNGDLNYDGVINGDDYAIIDGNYPDQGGPL
jgi:hypothetical protein